VSDSARRLKWGNRNLERAMGKITFRADDDLVRQLEEFDASKARSCATRFGRT
jgi:hypothetical protein